MVLEFDDKESGRKWGVPEERGITLSELHFTKIFQQQHEKERLGAERLIRGSDNSSGIVIVGIETNRRDIKETRMDRTSDQMNVMVKGREVSGSEPGWMVLLLTKTGGHWRKTA